MVDVMSPSYPHTSYDKPFPVSDESSSLRKLHELQPSWKNCNGGLESPVAIKQSFKFKPQGLAAWFNYPCFTIC